MSFICAPLFKALKIETVYTPHKIKNEDEIQGVKILPCPLYAVNIEDTSRNGVFKNFVSDDLINKERLYLYSFQGAFHPRWYLTDIRKKIFKMKHPSNTYIKYIGNWHFDDIVYNKKQNKDGELNISKQHEIQKESYNDLLLKSRYMLCPSGSGPNSIRLWEALAVGSIPIILADTLELPKHTLWKDTILRVKESDLEKLPNILKGISISREKTMRENCLKLYKYFKNNYRNN